MNHRKMLERAQVKVSAKALFLRSLNEKDSVDQEHLQTLEYIKALKDMHIFTTAQYRAAKEVLDAAVQIKKATPCATNTEDGKANKPTTSLEDAGEKVKSRARVCMEIFEGDRLTAEVAGTAQDLLTMLSCFASDLARSNVPHEAILQYCILGTTMPRTKIMKEEDNSHAE